MELRDLDLNLLVVFNQLILERRMNASHNRSASRSQG